MGLGHNTTIVRNGLVFYYDMSNTEKSFRGAPTTNLIQNPTNATWNLYAFTEGGASASSSSEVQPNGTTARVVNVTTGAGGYTNVQLFSNGIYSMTGGLTYSVSCRIWASVSCSIRIGVIKNGSPFTDYITLTVKNLSPGWNSISTSGSFGSTVTDGRFQLDFGFVPNNTILKVMNPQLEQNSFATPFVNGTRSNTQAILDLTNSNTITANSLTYNANGTFSFNGTSNYASFSIPATYTNYTIELWIKLSSTSGDQRWFSNSNNGTFTLRYSNGWSFHFNPLAGAPPSTVTSGSSIATVGTWYNVVATNDQSDSITGAKCYVNGVLIGTAIPAVSLQSTGETIGSREGTTSFGNGQCAITKIYNRALTANEIAQNFAALRDRYGI